MSLLFFLLTRHPSFEGGQIEQTNLLFYSCQGTDEPYSNLLKVSCFFSFFEVWIECLFCEGTVIHLCHL